ncbi:CRISPR-associated helicase Cas3' [Anaerotruncus rubiinfantis]|uniref:CRISPR-associated helicase Cas3' n=1 Tax=Anaerotruncus rubiinfantis TaxID=1720200 RepID=UPI000A8AB5B5|nr:CRISPR-associated helicase Cas3' [Anaerotruncus rubiinfantis]
MDADLLLDRLNVYITPWWDAKTPLNHARCEILRACLEAGRSQAPGLFTLTVPTGGGKTVATLAFALEHAKKYGKKRIIYVIPFTSIIEQTAGKFREILGNENVLEHHSNVDFGDDENDPSSTLKKLAAENWDMGIVVTTVVQFFESLFSNRSSRCRKLHNLADSVIIFDEAQTLPLPYLHPCVRAISELTVNYGASCVLCTATQPALAPLFEAVSPTLRPREIAPPVDPAVFHRVTFQHLGQLSDDALAARLNGHEQALCIVGTRKQAQAVFHLLAPEGSFHLSTLMTPSHRRAVLENIRARLKESLPCRVVSTSLIEAGVDVDFPVVYRAEAGLDSEIQAAGRCNREGRRPAEASMVYLFAPDSAYIAHLSHSLQRSLRLAQEATHSGHALDAPETIEQYFTALYRYSGSELDQKEIVPALEAGARTASFPFRTVADAFHLIENDMRAVLIPRSKEAAALAAQLRAGQRSRDLFRQVGQDSVNIYQEHFEALLKHNALEVPDESVAILTDLSLYDENTGLALLADTGMGIFL